MAFKREIDPNAPGFTELNDLAAERLGGKVLYATDDFFAEKENLIKPGRGIFIPDKYTEQGKWMDGWESRRKRTPGHDYCIIQLAARSRIKGFDIDTNHFLGNHPPHASIEAVLIEQHSIPANWEASDITWTEILPKSPLNPGSQHYYSCEDEGIYSHLRLHIYPDGGVARLKVYGEVHKAWDQIGSEQVLDLAAAINGAQALICNDMFFSDMSNLLMPGRGVNMGDGWETKRNRTPNNRDWVIIKLAHPGLVGKIRVDTCHFKGNYPDICSIDACYTEDDSQVKNDKVVWQALLPRQKLQADFEHDFEGEIVAHEKVSHIRLNIFPDGGISRLRLFGTIR